MTARERKRDAHEKIQLGGLVVKAGLRELADLDVSSDRYRRLKERGDAAFERDTPD